MDRAREPAARWLNATVSAPARPHHAAAAAHGVGGVRLVSGPIQGPVEVPADSHGNKVAVPTGDAMRGKVEVGCSGSELLLSLIETRRRVVARAVDRCPSKAQAGIAVHNEHGLRGHAAWDVWAGRAVRVPGSADPVRGATCKHFVAVVCKVVVCSAGCAVP